VNFDLSEEQTMLVQGAKRYVREQLGLSARGAAGASADGFSRPHWADFADMGWLALPISEGDGGLGGGDVEIALLLEELGRGLAVEPYADTAVLGTTLIAAADDAVLRGQLLGGIATGEFITALAHVEANGRDEYQTPVATLAVQTGTQWTLSGEKTRVHHGPAATHWIVSARSRHEQKFSLFVVDRKEPGVSVNAYELIDGTRAADLSFSNTPARPLIGDPQRAGTTLEHSLDRTVVALSAAVLGSMEAVVALTADYLKQRTQFGQSLSKFQALQHRMAEMFIETDQARSILLQALAALETNDPVRQARAASAAKALITQAAHFVTGQGIQLHGGIGITEEYAVSHHYKSALVFDQRLGDRHFHLARSAGIAAGPG
jgi:alkylation response protein AidB-like acyl-CoA dehydrogenase